MASKIMVKIPVTPFGQVNKSGNGDLVAVTRGQDVVIATTSNMKTENCQNRVSQLEQNIRFLQEQHQLMLSGLHQEIDNLRNRNRELQFQLVFMKGSIPSSPSSPEDDAKHKVYVSPKQVNIIPLQVEILEKELGEMKLQMQEVDSRNVYLSAIVDEQKKKLERYERDREKERERQLQPPSDPDLLRKLDDAETIIRRLRHENSDLRRENNQQFRESYNRENSRTSNNNRGRRGTNNYRNNPAWFPPLNSQNYWQRDNRQSGDTGLPCLESNSRQYQQGGRKGANNNHYSGDGGRKYRGGQSKNPKPS